MNYNIKLIFRNLKYIKKPKTVWAKDHSQIKYETPSSPLFPSSIIAMQPTVSSHILSQTNLLMSSQSETQLCQSSILNSFKPEKTFLNQNNLSNFQQNKVISYRKMDNSPLKNNINFSHILREGPGKHELLSSSISHKVFKGKNMSSLKTFSPIQNRVENKNPVYFNIYNSSLNPSSSNLLSKTFNLGFLRGVWTHLEPFGSHL